MTNKDLTNISSLIEASGQPTTQAEEPHETAPLGQELPEHTDLPEVTPEPERDALSPIRDAIDGSTHIQAQLEVSHPFTLLIEGPLDATQREDLLSMLSRYQMGIREVELEPQFESHRILLPRISEYAGIMISHKLRSANVAITFGPSDQVSGEITHQKPLTEVIDAGKTHLAESVILTNLATLPELEPFDVIDALSVSAALESFEVEAAKSKKFETLVEKLKTELKYRAFRKGAQAVIQLSMELKSLGSPSHYRLTLLGSAIKKHTKLK